MKAANHMDLIEQFDEAVYRKLKFFERSGPYWAGKNRPHRYDFIDNLLKYCNGGYSANQNYETKREIVEKRMAQNNQLNDFCPYTTFLIF